MKNASTRPASTDRVSCLFGDVILVPLNLLTKVRRMVPVHYDSLNSGYPSRPYLQSGKVRWFGFAVAINELDEKRDVLTGAGKFFLSASTHRTRSGGYHRAAKEKLAE